MNELSPSATTKKGRRGSDIEFATEIGQGLLLEVRKMQAALHQKEQQVNQLISQKADLERDNELMVSQLRQREEVQGIFMHMDYQIVHNLIVIYLSRSAKGANMGFGTCQTGFVSQHHRSTAGIESFTR